MVTEGVEDDGLAVDELFNNLVMPKITRPKTSNPPTIKGMIFKSDGLITGGLADSGG